MAGSSSQHQKFSREFMEVRTGWQASGRGSEFNASRSAAMDSEVADLEAAAEPEGEYCGRQMGVGSSRAAIRAARD